MRSLLPQPVPTRPRRERVCQQQQQLRTISLRAEVAPEFERTLETPGLPPMDDVKADSECALPVVHGQ